MTSFDTGDIVLVHYPFTYLSSLKKRPAVILSTRTYSERFGDVVLMPLTSQAESDATLAVVEWQSAGLLKPSWLKPIIGTLTAKLIEKRLGTLSETDFKSVRAALSAAIDAQWIRPDMEMKA